MHQSIEIFHNDEGLKETRLRGVFKFYGIVEVKEARRWPMTRDFLDPTPEEQIVVLIDAVTLRKPNNSSNPASTAIVRGSGNSF